MRVELLHHHGCCHAHAARQLLEECLRTVAICTPILVRVGDYPSPTVLVDGIDVMRPTHAVAPGRACRLDIPTRDRLLDILTAELAAETLRHDRPPAGRLGQPVGRLASAPVAGLS